MMSITRQTTNPGASPRPEHIHFRFLDGMRGFAALSVVIWHICGGFGSPEPKSLVTGFLFANHRISHLAHVSVCVFIVLSGFCLMLPVARSHDRRLSGGVKGFLQRRARRILPPYYAALALAFALITAHVLAQNFLKKSHLPMWPPWSTGNIVSHLLLIHNWRSVWAFNWDSPTWTVATEWQIYFVFAIVLLPIWRRFGILASTTVAAAIGVLPCFVAAAARGMTWACPWFVALFALGMLGAVAVVSTDRFWPKLRRQTRWSTLSAVSAVGILPIYVLLSDKDIVSWYWLLDCFAAIPILSLIVCCSVAATEPSKAQPVIMRLMESRWMQGLGAFSYSLYLVHLPIIEQIESLASSHLSKNPIVYLVFLLIVALPIAVGGAYLFHLVFERPFLRARQSTPAPLKTDGETISQ